MQSCKRRGQPGKEPRGSPRTPSLRKGRESGFLVTARAKPERVEVWRSIGAGAERSDSEWGWRLLERKWTETRIWRRKRRGRAASGLPQDRLRRLSRGPEPGSHSGRESRHGSGGKLQSGRRIFRVGWIRRKELGRRSGLLEGPRRYEHSGALKDGAKGRYPVGRGRLDHEQAPERSLCGCWRRDLAQPGERRRRVLSPQL